MDEENKESIIDSIKDDLIEIMKVYVIPRNERNYYLKCLGVDFHTILERYKINKIIYDYNYSISLDGNFINLHVDVILSQSINEMTYFIDLEIELKELINAEKND